MIAGEAQEEVLSDAASEFDAVDAASFDDDEEKPPRWALRQFKMMKAINDKMGIVTTLQQAVTQIKDELGHVKLQAGLAQDAAEGALEIGQNVEDRVQSLEAQIVSCADIKKMIDEAITGLSALIAETVRRHESHAQLAAWWLQSVGQDGPHGGDWRLRSRYSQGRGCELLAKTHHQWSCWI